MTQPRERKVLEGRVGAVREVSDEVCLSVDGVDGRPLVSTVGPEAERFPYEGNDGLVPEFANEETGLAVSGVEEGCDVEEDLWEFEQVDHLGHFVLGKGVV